MKTEGVRPNPAVRTVALQTALAIGAEGSVVERLLAAGCQYKLGL
jgi:hypothetical protein